MTDTSIDRPAAPDAAPPEPDAHGRAAMLLIESLIHGLVARSLLSVANAVEIVEIARDVTADMAAEMTAGDAVGDPVVVRRSLALLEAIGDSLKNDLHPAA